jgi:hypothetical protein
MSQMSRKPFTGLFVVSWTVSFAMAFWRRSTTLIAYANSLTISLYELTLVMCLLTILCICRSSDRDVLCAPRT